VKELLYSPQSGKKMTIVFLVSGSGTNYREIVKRNPDYNYLVFTNRPECGAVAIAKENRHEVVELSHIPYLRETRRKYGPGNTPINCPERLAFEQDAIRLIEDKLENKPDLICMAGYDLWITEWMVERYYPHILNVHPGDTIKGYVGLHWVPAAKAIIAGENSLRSTLFIVDKGGDTGPVMVQSAPLYIESALLELESEGKSGLISGLSRIKTFLENQRIHTLEEFQSQADQDLKSMLEHICRILQGSLKVMGDWKIYPFAVHDLIARGRVGLDGRQVYVDNRELPEYGYRLDVVC